MDIADMSIDELENAIIKKLGKGKSAYRENSTQFAFLCEAYSDDPLVIEYDRKTDELPIKDTNTNEENFLKSIGRCR